MEKDKVRDNPDFESYWLTHANADAVFTWLKEQKPDFQEEGLGFMRDQEIEKVLLERHEPIIDLGLALYAKLTIDSALCLFENGDTTIRKALLAGPSVDLNFDFSFRNPIPSLRPWIDQRGILEDLLQSFDDNIELLGFLFSNESVPVYLLTALYERTDPFNELTDEHWIRAVELTILNPAISNSTYRNTLYFFWDKTMPMPRYGAEDVFYAAWKLFDTVPVNEDSARILSRFGETLVPHGEWDIPSAPSGMDVLATIRRWEVENEDKYGTFRKCRATLGRLLENEELKDSDDIALRQAYYAKPRFSPKPEDVRKTFERDKGKFLEVAIENLSFYYNEEVRDELRQCCHDYAFKDEYRGHRIISPDMYCLNRFDVQSDLLEREHPELFPNSHGDIPFHAVSDLSLRGEKRLVFLQEQIKAISQELIGTKTEDEDPSWYDEEKASLISKMKAELDQSNQLILSKLASVTGWVVFVGIAVAIILIVVLIKL